MSGTGSLAGDQNRYFLWTDDKGYQEVQREFLEAHGLLGPGGANSSAVLVVKPGDKLPVVERPVNKSKRKDYAPVN